MHDFVKGKPVANPHEAIRLFAFCEAMKWTHLPAGGSLYDQNPRLLDCFELIFARRAAYQEQKQKQDEAKRKAEQTRSKRR